jgi:hypothetical protein
MALRPEMALGGGLATAALAVALYSRTLPPSADLRLAGQGDVDAEGARKQAFYTSLAVVSGISLLAKDGTIFVTGGLVILALEWSARHAIWLDPASKSAQLGGPRNQRIASQYEDDEMYGPSTLSGVA